MEMIFREYARLPTLAWGAVFDGKTVVVHHGPGLEHGEDWCVDGCWPGRFEAGIPEGDTDGFFAFALRIKKDELWIDTPTNPLEKVCLLREGGRLFISPSIPFVCALAKVRVDPAYPYYQFDFFHFNSCIETNCGETPLADGRHLQVIVNRRVIVSKDLSYQTEYRSFERSFRSYEEYSDFLIGGMNELRDNVTSPARRAGGYGLISSISSGYDSPALNAVGAPLGWKEAITFVSDNDRSDSGEAVGAALGVKIHCVDRQAYRASSELCEAEFLATGMRGEDIDYAGAVPHLRDRTLVTGTHGDVWNRNQEALAIVDLYRTNTTGCGLTEFRWRTRLLHAPMFHYGGMGMRSLQTIARSRAMEPWSVGGAYNRPIQRRMLEERGVPREAFGRLKRGAISVIFTAPGADLEQLMSPTAWASFQEFLRTHQAGRRFSTQAKAAAKYAAYRVDRFTGTWLKKIGVIDQLPERFDLRHRSIPGVSSYLFAWAVSIIEERYAEVRRA